MDGVFMPIEWYAPTPASDPIPIKWAGWLNGEWIVISAFTVEE